LKSASVRRVVAMYRAPDYVHTELQPVHVGRNCGMRTRDGQVDWRRRTTLLLHLWHQRLQRLRIHPSSTQPVAAQAKVVAWVLTTNVDVWRHTWAACAMMCPLML